ncbi:MAG: hypothetical protein ACXVXZ_07825, partial [Mycobacteriaceae bacterium]
REAVLTASRCGLPPPGPRLIVPSRPPDVVLLRTSAASADKISLGIEVNIMVAAAEQPGSRGGLVVARVNARMPCTLCEGQIDTGLIDNIARPDPRDRFREGATELGLN